MRYKAFISYSHRDEAIAKKLHRRLERFRPPRGLTLPNGAAPERLYPIYRDREEMSASPSLPATIEAALAASDHLIVLCSPASAASKWVNQEISLFVAARGADRVLPVILSGHPPDCFPEAMRAALAEPLAPDFRDGKDGYDDGVLKIIAGLWGAPFGALKDREAARQRRRARLNAGIAAVFAALTVFAGFSAWRAIEQEQRAIAEAQAAEARSLAAVARFTFDQNPGETSVAAMITAQSLRLKPTPEAHELLRDALKLAPLGATTSPYPWLRPIVETSRDGNVAAFMSAYSSNEAPAHSTIVRLSPELVERDRIAFEGLAEPVISADGAWMAASGRLRRLFVQNLTSGETALDQPMKSGFAATFSPDGATLYAATQLGEVFRWSAGMSEASQIAFTPGGGARLTLPDLSLLANGEALLRTESGRPGAIISVKDGSLRHIPFTPKYQKIAWTEHTPQGAVANPDGARFIAYESFNSGALRDAETLKAVWSFDGKSRSWSRAKANVISSEGAHYARGRSDGEIIVRGTADGAVLHRSNHGGAVAAMTFLDQPILIAAAGDGGATIWRIGQDQPISRCASDAKILSMVLDAGGFLLLGTQDGRLVRCDPETGKALAAASFGAPVTSIAVASGEIAIALKQSDYADNWTELLFANRLKGTTTRLSLNEAFSRVKLNHDGSRAATWSWPTREVAIWDTATGALLNRFAARGDLVGLTPDGDRVLMNHQSLDIYDVTSAKRLRQLGEAAGVSSVLATPYQNRLITNGEINGVSEHWGWNAETGARQWRLPGDVVMAPDGAAYAEFLKGERRWRVLRRATGEEIGAASFLGEAAGATLSPTGETITIARRVTNADGDFSYETELWDTRRNRMIWKRDGGGANTPFSRVISLTKERAAYVYASRDKSGMIGGGLSIFDWPTGEDVFSTRWRGSGSPQFEVDPNAQEVLIAASGQTTLRRLSDGKALWSLDTANSRSMAFSPTGDVIITAMPRNDGQDVIGAFDRRTGKRLRQWPVDAKVQDIAITSDGDLVLAALEGDEKSEIRAWRIADGAPVHEIEIDAHPRRIIPLGEPDRVIVHDYKGFARSFNLDQKREENRFAMSIRAAEGAFSADGAHAITAHGARLRYWDARTGEQLDVLDADGQITTLAISSDGAEASFVTRRKRKARGGADTPLVQIWRPTTDDQVEVLAATRPRRLAYGPQDAVLVISSGDTAYRVFDARTLAPRFTIRPLANGAFTTGADASGLFTGDGRHFAVEETGSYGQSNVTEKRAALRVFNLANGTEVARFDIHPNRAGIAATQSGFYYSDNTGRSRHFEIGAKPLDRVLTERPHDRIMAIPGRDLILASGYRGGDVLINIRTGDRTNLTIERDNHHTLDSAVDPTGRFIALSRARQGDDGKPISEILIVDAITGERLSTTRPLPIRAMHVDFAENGEAIIAAEKAASSSITNSSDGAGLFRWRWRNGNLTPLIQNTPVADFEISRDGAWLVASEGGKHLDTEQQYGQIQSRLVHIADGQTHAIRPHDLHAPNLAISDDGQRFGVFSAASPTSGEIIEIKSGGKPETLLEISLEDAAIFAAPLGFIDSGARFVMGERSGARVFDLETGQARRLRVPGRAKKFALSSDGALIAIGGESFVSIWDLETLEQITNLKGAQFHGLSFAGEDGRSLIAQTSAGALRLEWDQETLITTACRAFQNDAWASGVERIATSEASGACLR